jgi:hypothetical protein
VKENVNFIPLEARLHRACAELFDDMPYKLEDVLKRGCDTEVNPASNRNEYHEYFLGGEGRQCLRLTTLRQS